MEIRFVLLVLFVFLSGCKNSDQKKEKLVVTATKMCAPITTDRSWYLSEKKAPLFEGMGELHFPISTKNELVQKYVNQGLVLAYGFNHAEAARLFYYATKLDPNCAMAFWGYAYVLGPNYNAGMDTDNYRYAYQAIQKALTLSKEKNVTQRERDLIQALSTRYVSSPVEDRLDLDIAYADAMKALFKTYSEDADIGVLYVESLMNLHPWDLYDKEGKEKKWTPEIVSVLEKIIEKYPRHPGAHHFYIHAVEASNIPERALKSAELFDKGLVANAGHLVHMPSHVYIRTGDYHKGTLANLQSIKVDSAYVTACNAQGAYPLAYYPHNQHFMAATATLEGNSKWALYAAEALKSTINKQLMKDPDWSTIQHYYTIPYYVYVKFGKWDCILDMENEFPELVYPTAIWHYARGMSYTGKGNLMAAKMELEALEKVIGTHKELKEITIWNINSVYDLVQIAQKVLKASIVAQEGDFLQSIDLLKDAVAIEDSLNYNEPPDWFFSVRHYLGAVQLEAGAYENAISTYQQDLRNLPKNGWALRGLSLAYSKLGDESNRKRIEEMFTTAWRTADMKINTSIVK